MAFLASVACLGAASAAGSQALDVGPDHRIEAMSMIFRFAGNPEYSQGKVMRWMEEIERLYGRFRQHEAVAAARKLREERGISYDAVISLAVHVGGAPDFKELVPLDPMPETLDPRWTPKDARDFLSKARKSAPDARLSSSFGAQGLVPESAAFRLQRWNRRLLQCPAPRL